MPNLPAIPTPLRSLNPDLSHSAADILAQALIDLDYVSELDSQTWPVKVASEPDLPERVVTIYDTVGRVFDRSSPDSKRLEYPGVQIRVRGQNPGITFQKARQLATALDSINQFGVYLDGAFYHINTVIRTSEPIALGKVPPGKLNVFTINALVSYKTPVPINTGVEFWFHEDDLEVEAIFDQDVIVLGVPAWTMLAGPFGVPAAQSLVALGPSPYNFGALIATFEQAGFFKDRTVRIPLNDPMVRTISGGYVTAGDYVIG